MSQKFRLAYTVLDAVYQNGSLRVITGDDAVNDGNFGSLQNPLDLKANIAATDSDPVVYSYMKGTELRLILGKIGTGTPPAPASTCAYSVLTPLVAQEAADVVLQDSAGTPVATNPHGVVEVGDYLYIISYDQQAIYRISKTALDGNTSGIFTIAATAITDLTSQLDDPDAKGQALIALNGNLFALFIVNDPTQINFQPSILVKLSVDSATGALTYVNQVNVGANAMSIIPVTTSNNRVTLLVPAVGGNQQYTAASRPTNGTASNIYAVDPVSFTQPAGSLLTGDDKTTPPTAYDIHAVAASINADSDGPVYILTLAYEDPTSTDIVYWRLYKATVSGILGAGGTTLSAAVSAGRLTVADSGTINAGGTFSGIWYWDIFIENGETLRLWFLKGSAIEVTDADNYSASDKLYPLGTDPGAIGGQNVNSADLLAETLRQAAGVSLKRGLRGKAPAQVKAAARSAARKGAAEEEKGKK